MKSLLVLFSMFLVAALSDQASATPTAPEFAAGDYAPVCTYFQGNIAGLMNKDSVDSICFGPFKVLGKNEKNTGYHLDFGGRVLEVGSQFLGEMLPEAELPNGPRVKVGQEVSARYCDPNSTLSCKVEAIARVHDRTTNNVYNYYVKFEGQQIWFHNMWFSYFDLKQRRYEALAAAALR